ncbi:hypothetical protein EVA_17020 [gut metagenome]|uniref:Uncharacterized protein n=1 Tax=gut metagenome TaxID=749906 RepID=J9G5S7_9ZZZZ
MLIENRQLEGVSVAPQEQQHQNTHIAYQSHTHIAQKTCLLPLFLASTHRQQEEWHTAHIAQHHHGQIQAVIVTHHTAVQHTQHGSVSGDG